MPGPGGVLDIDLRIDAAADGVLLRAALLQGSANDACEGRPAEAVGRAGDRKQEAPLVAGERLRLRFARDATKPFAAQGAHLGLYLTAPGGVSRCLAMPLWRPGTAPSFTAAERFTLGLDLVGEGVTPTSGGIGSIVTITPMFGVWAGGFHFGAGVGMGGVICPRSECPVASEDEKEVSETVFPISAVLTRPLWHKGATAAGLALRYRRQPLRVDAVDRQARDLGHVIQLAPYFGVQSIDALGELVPGLLVGFEFPVGVMLTREGRRSVVLGGNLRTQFTLL